MGLEFGYVHLDDPEAAFSCGVEGGHGVVGRLREADDTAMSGVLGRHLDVEDFHQVASGVFLDESLHSDAVREVHLGGVDGGPSEARLVNARHLQVLAEVRTHLSQWLGQPYSVDRHGDDRCRKFLEELTVCNGCFC